MFRTNKINVPVLGLVENMAWFTPAELPDNRYYIFGKDGCKNLASKMKIPLLGQIPLVQEICESGDAGNPVALGDSETAVAFEQMVREIVKETDKRNSTMDPTKRLIIN